jgi:hypothetical protein
MLQLVLRRELFEISIRICPINIKGTIKVQRYHVLMMTERESRLARLNIDRGSTGSYREKPLLASYFQQ